MSFAGNGGTNGGPGTNVHAGFSPLSVLGGLTLVDTAEQRDVDLLHQIAIESGVSTSNPSCSSGSSVYYDDLYYGDSADEQQRTIELLEEENAYLRNENRMPSPAPFYETWTTPPEIRSAVSLPSPVSSLHTPLNPSPLLVAPNGRATGRQKPSKRRDLGNPNSLPHPFMSAPLDDNGFRAPLPSPSPIRHSPIIEVGGDSRTHSDEEAANVQNFPLLDLAESDSSSADLRLDSRTSPRPLERNLNEAASENRERRIKRLRFESAIRGSLNTSEVDREQIRTFSTATTAVNTAPVSPDDERMVRIAIESTRHPITITCPENLFLEVSDLCDSTCFRSHNNMATIYPEEKVPHIKAKTVKLFVHWLYHQRFTPPGEKSCGFRQLLELYYLGHAYAMPHLKNVVLHQLMKRVVNHEVPAGLTRRMYSLTPSNDPLRRLWVDFYLWDVSTERFSTEINSGNLDPLFLQDLALAQMKKLRAFRKRPTMKKPLHMIPPYVTNPETYQIRPTFTEPCSHQREPHCPACDFEAYEQVGRAYEIDENHKIASLLAFCRMKFEEKIIRENIYLRNQKKRLQHKMRTMVPEAKVKIRRKIRHHRFVPHYRLLTREIHFDYPGENWVDLVEGGYPGMEEVEVYHESSWRGRVRGRVVEGLGI